MSDIFARVAVSAQQALNAHAKKHGIEVTSTMVDDLTISAKRRLYASDSMRSIYAHIQCRAEQMAREKAEHKRLINSMLCRMADANNAYLCNLQAG